MRRRGVLKVFIEDEFKCEDVPKIPRQGIACDSLQLKRNFCEHNVFALVLAIEADWILLVRRRRNGDE